MPNAESLSDLFVDVVQRAGLEPPSISVVEAHGTGTRVGDPAEYDGIHRVLGGRVGQTNSTCHPLKAMLAIPSTHLALYP